MNRSTQIHRQTSALRLGRLLRRTLYLLLATLVASGAAWLVAHYTRPDDALPSPVEPWSMKLHGAAAMGAIFIAGALLHRHVLPAWRARRNRAAGAAACLALGALLVSGYGLYYFDGEGLRRVTERLHWITGFGLPALLLWHVLKGRRSRRRP